MARVAQIERPVPGEGLAVAARARRQHAIEHVDAAQHRAHDIVRLAHAHQIVRSVGGQMRHRRVERVEHRGLAFTDRKTADRITVEADLHAVRSAERCAQMREDAALYDAETAAALAARRKPLSNVAPSAWRARAIFRCRASSRDRPGIRRAPSGYRSRADTESPSRVRAREILPCRRYANGSARPLRVILRSFDERHHLEPAGIGEDRPSHPMNLCSPPSRAMRSAPGRSIR